MEPTDITIQILQRIQETLVRIEKDHGQRLANVEEAIGGLRSDIGGLRSDMDAGFAATNAAIGVLTEQVGFFGRAATPAAEARSRLEDRFDDLARRVEALENRDH